MTEIPQSLLAKVRALLMKAENPAVTEHEREAFFGKATELMAKYGIEAAMLADRRPDQDKPTDRILTVDNPRSMEKVRLLCGLAEAMRCKSVHFPLRHGEARKSRRVHLFGFASDLERIDMLYTSLLMQITNGLHQLEVPRYESPRAYRTAWVGGFRARVVARVDQMERRAAAEATPTVSGRSTALVLADRTALVKRHLNETYPKLRKGGNACYSTINGFRAGVRAGDRADIGQARIGESTNRRIVR